jgi:hypothetical protein
MAKTVKITTSSVGADSGPYNLFSDATGFTSAFETNISKAALIAGFVSYNVPDATTIIRVRSLAPCNNYVDSTVPVVLAGTWYSMQEQPGFAITYTSGTCGGEYRPSITLTINSIAINQVEKIIGAPYTKTFTHDSMNIIPADNTVPLTCLLGAPTGYTYTDFVDLLNEAFTDLGLTQYKAQVSLIDKPGPFTITPIEPAYGFYIVRPRTDVFSIKTATNGGIANLIYTNNYLTKWDGTVNPYKGITESGITIVGGVVIEPTP